VFILRHRESRLPKSIGRDRIAHRA
jgi:hypothetical protein